MQSFDVGSQVEKRLMAGVHGVRLSSGQAGDALAGTNFPGVKILPTRWIRPGHHSITGLPVCDRAGSPAVSYLFVSFCLAGRKRLDSGGSWRMLVLRAGWRRVGGFELSWCKDTPTRWMRPGHSSITGLPVSDRAGSPPVAYLFVSFCLAGRRSTAVSHPCFPELSPGSRGFCQHRQTR